jgi:TetR/AcrR family transcriptional regulator
LGGRFDAFLSLENEKQQRIIKSALVEFGINGFKRASTNTIAENAQIGKGMLFYYFGSKKELFDFLCEYTLEWAKNKYLREFKADTGDFLERYRKLTELKRKAITASPEIIKFYESFYHEGNAPYVEKFTAEAQEVRRQAIDSLYGGIDYSLFRDDIDGEAVVRYIRWLFDGYTADTEVRFRQGRTKMDETALAAEWKRFYAFVDDLHHIFYREE